MFVSTFGGAFGVFTRYQIKEIIDEIAQNKNIHLVSATFLFILFVALNHIVFFISRLLDIRYKPRILSEIVKSAYTKTMKHSLHWFDSHLSGEIASKITDLQDGIITVITVIFRSLTIFMFVIIGLFFVFQMNYISGVLLLVCLCIYTPIMVKLLHRQMILQKQYVSARQESVGIINDSITNVFGIKIIGNLTNEMKLKLIPSVRRWSQWDRKTRVYDAWYVDMADTIMAVIMNGAQILLLGYLYQSNAISAGEFAFITGTMLHIHEDIDQLLENVLFSINPKLAGIKASFEFMNRCNDEKELKVLPKVSGEIEYRNVNFSYDNQKIILKSFNLKIRSGEKIGIVGLSGAGKTTLIKCLLKYFPLSGGSILIEGNDISQFSEASVRANISVIPQDITMFHRSILENLQIAKYDASIEEIQTACKMAKIHDDIEKMPNGYDTIVGERGVKLSGGQRQRIAIARAILKKAPILILDEATSALDTATELLIQESIQEVLSTFSATMIVIAHRLSTIAHMDRIIVLDNGRIVSEGTHEELLGKNEIYSKLWNVQINGLIS